ncbi:MAG TPA: hypothetical protein VGC70_01505 [Burkholderiales bacterium]
MPTEPTRESHAQFELSLSAINNDWSPPREAFADRRKASVRLNDRDSTLLLVALTARLQFWRNALGQAEEGEDMELYGAAAAYHADYERLLRALTRGELP